MTQNGLKRRASAKMKNSDLWARLSGSPVLRPTTPSVTSSLPPERIDEVDEEMSDVGSPAMLDSLVHLHELPPNFAYAYFERDCGVSDIETPNGVVVGNRLPVVPRVVLADSIQWKPVLSSSGLQGHRFELLFDGALQAHVEVFTDATSIHRVAFVHAHYTTLARAAGTIDRGALIEFNSPTSHLAKLQAALTNGVGQLQCYLPVNEVVVGSALDPNFGLPLAPHARHAKNPLWGVAAAVWRRTREEMHAISNVARDASERHNASELARSGLG